MALESAGGADRCPEARWGLVNRVVPAAALLDAARELAGAIRAAAPLAVAAVLEILRETDGLGVRAGYEILRSGGLPAYRAMLDSEDAREGARAFAEPGARSGGPVSGRRLKQPAAFPARQGRPYRARGVDRLQRPHDGRLLLRGVHRGDRGAADHVGLGAAYRAETGWGMYTAESHLCFSRSAGAGERLRYSSQLLGHDEKRLHVFHRMTQEPGGQEVATIELMFLHVDLAVQRVAPIPPALAGLLSPWPPSTRPCRYRGWPAVASP